MEKQEIKEAIIEALKEDCGPNSNGFYQNFSIRKILNGFLVVDQSYHKSSELYFPTKEEAKDYICERLNAGL